MVRIGGSSTASSAFDKYFIDDRSPQPWEKKYAIFPHWVNGKWVWFDYYYRRMVWTEYKAGAGYTDNKWAYENGTLFDVLATQEL